MELHSRVCSSPRFRLDGGGRRHSDYDGREAAARRWRYSRKLPVPSSTEVSPPSPWRTFMLPRASPINMLSHPCKEGKSVRQRPPAFTRFPNSRGAVLFVVCTPKFDHLGCVGCPNEQASSTGPSSSQSS
jgi:hypothetical protein